MDWNSILPAIITGLVTFAGFLITNDKTTAILGERIDQNAKRTDERIDALSRHVERHNGVIERTFKLETEVDNIKDELRKVS